MVPPEEVDSHVMSASRGGRVALRAGLVVGAAVVALLLLEAALRITGTAPPPGLFTVTREEYERIPGIFGPSQRVRGGIGSRFEHEARIDSLGFRGADFPRAKPAGEFRVLYVGDSFTYGHNVADEAALPAQLEASLQRVCGQARVVNAGVSGSTIAGQDEMVRRGLAVAPDLVILMYHENDIDELAYSRIWEQLAENRRIKSRFPVSLTYRLLRSSAIWNIAQNVRRGRSFQPAQSAGTREAAEARISDDTTLIDAARAEYVQRLAAITDTLRAHETPFLFVLFPHPESVRESRGGRDYEWIRLAAVGLSLPVVDLLPPLLASTAPIEELFLVPEDYHPSAVGYAVGARSITTVVVERFAGPRC